MVALCMSSDLTGNGEEGWMKIVRGILSLVLIASGLIGTQILLTDKWLWSAAPLHAYGLVGFVMVDIVLATVALARTNAAALGAALIAATQFGAMLADGAAGQPAGVPSIAFRGYLLSDSSYLGLLIIQIGILITAIGTLTTPLIYKHGRWKAVLLSRRH
jgi:hypothetical protein